MVLTAARALLVLSLSKALTDFFRSSETPTNVFPLSLYKKIGWHLRQVNHGYALRKVSVFKSGHVSKWTARVTRHVKISP